MLFEVWNGNSGAVESEDLTPLILKLILAYDVIASAHEAWLQVHLTQKKFKLNSDGGDSGSKKCKDLVESVFWKSLESGSWFSVAVFGRKLASVTMKNFFVFNLVYNGIL